MKHFDEVIRKGSGFTLETINELVVEVNKYEPLAGSSFIQLPKFLKDKKAIVNVMNDDEQCFKWAVLSALYPAVNNPGRVTNYLRYQNDLNFTGIDFPMEINKIDKFESLNSTISINLYHYHSKDKTVYPLRLTKSVKRNHIHLLMLTKTDDDGCEGDDTDENFHTNRKSHFCWIKNLSRLINSQVSKNNRKSFFCDRCLNHFRELGKLVKHRADCMKQNDVAIVLPSIENNKIKFKNFKNKLKSPSQEFSKSCSTTAEQEHEVYSVGYYFHCSYDSSNSFYKSRRGPDCVDWFIDELQDIAQFVKPLLDKVIPMNITPENVLNFREATVCHICCAPFNADDVKVRDHNHLTGEYRGAAHSNCNLQFKESRDIPVVFHNLSGYDAHFLVTKLANGFEGDMTVRAMEKKMC